MDGECLRKENRNEKEKNEKILSKYKILESEYDLLKIEHKKIVEHCKFLEQIVEIKENNKPELKWINNHLIWSW